MQKEASKEDMPIWSFHDTFSTHAQMRNVVSRVLDDVRTRFSAGEETWYDIKVILNELCCNALEHGKDPVEVFSAYCAEDHMLHILVADSGEGYTPELQSSPDADSERGRGLAIVHSLARDMVFNKAANKVLVRIQI